MSDNQERWLLPEGVQDVLPEQAAALEYLRRRCLDLYASYGYELVFPPLMEFRESLLTGVGHDLALSTFSLIDQLSGRQLGLRADMTPQVARIDAHCRPVTGVARYCYAGTVLHTLPQHLGAPRCMVQMGCELYGYAGIEADLEMLELLLNSLNLAGCRQVVLELGHVGIFRGLLQGLHLDSSVEAELFDILQRKAKPELRDLLAQLPQAAATLSLLPDLAGDAGVIQRARTRLHSSSPTVMAALDDLQQVVDRLKVAFPDVQFYVDLAELRGYHYHTGLSFAAYVDESRFEVAKGGRYDAVGEAFGRSRPATGFSMDVLALCGQSSTHQARVLAPHHPEDKDLQERIRQLRQQGDAVVVMLPGQPMSSAPDSDRQLVFKQGQWQLLP
ncbi:MAG: ATP phosphoribosyltransferase regulatory subunit [Pseudomonadales bacterium]|nr:ATP phosphoribosyltransferase regulatory subunit [Pseudomonadales bacterium]